MNLASWIILGIVILFVGLAIRATFFKKKRKGGCCDTWDEPIECSSLGCSSCSCTNCSIAKNAQQPTIKYLD